MYNSKRAIYIYIFVNLCKSAFMFKVCKSNNEHVGFYLICFHHVNEYCSSVSVWYKNACANVKCQADVPFSFYYLNLIKCNKTLVIQTRLSLTLSLVVLYHWSFCLFDVFFNFSAELAFCSLRLFYTKVINFSHSDF